MLEKCNGSEKYKEICRENIKIVNERIDNIDDYVKQLKKEKEILPKYKERIERLIISLENKKW